MSNPDLAEEAATLRGSPGSRSVSLSPTPPILPSDFRNAALDQLSPPSVEAVRYFPLDLQQAIDETAQSAMPKIYRHGQTAFRHFAEMLNDFVGLFSLATGRYPSVSLVHQFGEFIAIPRMTDQCRVAAAQTFGCFVRFFADTDRKDRGSLTMHFLLKVRDTWGCIQDNSLHHPALTFESFLKDLVTLTEAYESHLAPRSLQRVEVEEVFKSLSRFFYLHKEREDARLGVLKELGIPIPVVAEAA